MRKASVRGLFLVGGLFVLAVLLACCSKRKAGSDGVEGADVQPNLEEHRSFAQELLEEHNYARTKPKEYAERFIKPWFGRTQGYAESCYQTMTTMRPVGALTLDERFCRAAQWFADDLGRTGWVAHVGSDGSSPRERCEREGAMNACAESCSWGIKEARGVLVQLLIDQGVKELGHRKNALNPDARVIGVGQKIGGKAAHNVATVIDYGR